MIQFSHESLTIKLQKSFHMPSLLLTISSTIRDKAVVKFEDPLLQAELGIGDEIAP